MPLFVEGEFEILTSQTCTSGKAVEAREFMSFLRDHDTAITVARRRLIEGSCCSRCEIMAVPWPPIETSPRRSPRRMTPAGSKSCCLAINTLWNRRQSRGADSMRGAAVPLWAGKPSGQLAIAAVHRVGSVKRREFARVFRKSLLSATNAFFYLTEVSSCEFHECFSASLLRLSDGRP